MKLLQLDGLSALKFMNQKFCALLLKFQDVTGSALGHIFPSSFAFHLVRGGSMRADPKTKGEQKR